MVYNFESKWNKVVSDPQNTEERSIFVDVEKRPETQRQFELYQYFIFIQKILKKEKVFRVLELGSGRGTMGLYLAKYMRLDVSLLDRVSEAIQIAREAFAENGTKGSFYTADALDTHIPENYFDAIVSIGLAEHFPNVDPLFREQYRMLRPGGVMISLNIPRKNSIQILNTAMRFFKKIAGIYKEDIRKDYYRNPLRPDDFKKSAKLAGFTNLSIIHTCPFPLFIPVKLSTDYKITAFYRLWFRWRALFREYPNQTNRLIARSHFLVGYKP